MRACSRLNCQTKLRVPSVIVQAIALLAKNQFKCIHKDGKKIYNIFLSLHTIPIDMGYWLRNLSSLGLWASHPHFLLSPRPGQRATNLAYIPIVGFLNNGHVWGDGEGDDVSSCFVEQLICADSCQSRLPCLHSNLWFLFCYNYLWISHRSFEMPFSVSYLEPSYS